MPAGYSGKPTWQKLGFKPGVPVMLIRAPADYAKLIGGLPRDIEVSPYVIGAPRMIHMFTTSRQELSAQLKTIRKKLAPDGTVWVSWPKKASKMQTDITEDVIREVALPMGYVDVKVCAVSEVWSGLKLMIRLVNRPKG